MHNKAPQISALCTIIEAPMLQERNLNCFLQGLPGCSGLGFLTLVRPVRCQLSHAAGDDGSRMVSTISCPTDPRSAALGLCSSSSAVLLRVAVTVVQQEREKSQSSVPAPSLSLLASRSLWSHWTSTKCAPTQRQPRKRYKRP